MSSHPSTTPRSVGISNMITLTVTVLPIAVLLTGCASSQGFNRGELRQSLIPNATVESAEIAAALAKKPQLPKPFRVAVHFREPSDRNQPNSRQLWRWKDTDKKTVYQLKNSLKFNEEVAAIFPLARELVSGDRIEDLRLSAAQQGADALLVVSGTSSIDQYNGKFGWTYAALVTALFVPASTMDALFLTQASLWDVRNGFLYMTAEAEETTSETAPLAWLDEKPLIEKSKDAAMNLLADEISRQIDGLLSSPTQAKAQ
jgi:hypothetical protein